MKIALVCDTSYQILNAMNIVYHLKQQAQVVTDLYVGHQFPDSQGVAARVAETGLFDNVYGYSVRAKTQGIMHKLDRVLDIVFPARALKAQLNDDVNFKEKKYDRIYASMATHFSVSLCFMYPDVELIYYDDGIGRYVHELSLSMMSPQNRKIYGILGKDLKCIVPSTILLNNPALAADEIRSKVKPLPKLTDAPKEFWNMTRNIWNYSADGYYADHELIWLTECNEFDDPVFDEVYDQVRGILGQYSEDCIVRPHPRIKDFDYGTLKSDDHREMWELVCADQIKDSHVLISDYSTATIVPKMLFDSEPYVVFLYRLHCDKEDPQMTMQCDAVVEHLKASYRDPSKVYNLKFAQELEPTLKKLCDIVSEKRLVH